MFVHSYGDKVQALDAATGDLLWQYSAACRRGGAERQARHLDLRHASLRADLRRAHRRARREDRQGRVGPSDRRCEGGLRPDRRPARRERQGDGRHDRPRARRQLHRRARCGDRKRAWRFYTIAQPGRERRRQLERPAAREAQRRIGLDSRQLRSGPEPRVLRPGNTYDTGPLRNRSDEAGRHQRRASTRIRRSRSTSTPEGSRGSSSISPTISGISTGRSNGRSMQLPVGGTHETVVVTAGKQMIFDVMEADTGKYLFVDRSRPAERRDGDRSEDRRQDVDRRSLVPGDGETKFVCPHVPAARSPGCRLRTTRAPKILYVPLVEACMDLTPVAPGERGSLSTGVRWTLRPRPDSDGNTAACRRINLETRKTVWTSRQRAPMTTGTLATAGGLVFAGALDRMFAAYDDDDGRATVADAAERRAEQRADQLYRATAGSTSRWSSATAALRRPVPGAGAGDPESAGSRRGGLGVRAAGARAALARRGTLVLGPWDWSVLCP